MKEIKLTFEWDGKTVNKETSGFTGQSCATETEFIEQALGKGLERKYKNDFYAPELVGNNQENKLIR